MKNVLLINACARAESRTLPLAKKAAAKISADYSIVNLFEKKLKPVDKETLAKRDSFIDANDFSDDMFLLAKQFKEAEDIVIAAPYWDLSFPSVLKCYLEAICVNGLTFKYGENGIPVSLCNAKRLIYVTTAGGYIGEANFGYDYIKALFAGLFGVSNSVCIKAEGLDIYGNDTEEILNNVVIDLQKSENDE